MKLPNGNITHRAWADWKFDAVVIIGPTLLVLGFALLFYPR